VILKRSPEILKESRVKSSVKSSVKIIELINQNINTTIPELAKQLDITERAVEKQLANLKKQGKIERVGPDKGGFWKIIKEDKKDESN
jgi:ATP-dependent DNA helicase RecG